MDKSATLERFSIATRPLAQRSAIGHIEHGHEVVQDKRQQSSADLLEPTSVVAGANIPRPTIAMDTVTPAITVGREKNLPDEEFAIAAVGVKLTAPTRLVRMLKKLKYVRIAFSSRQSVRVGGRNRKREL